MQYARFKALHELENLHPVYAAMINSNITIGPWLAATIIEISGSEHLARNIVGLLYGSLYAVGLPLIAASLNPRSKLFVFLVLAIIYAMAPWNEKIYGYNPQMFITGFAASSTFFIAIGLVLFRKIYAAVLIWAFHLFLHPTTAIFWSPFLFALSALTAYGDRNYVVKRETQIKFAIFLTPIFIGILILILEKTGVFSKMFLMNSFSF